MKMIPTLGKKIALGSRKPDLRICAAVATSTIDMTNA